MLAAAQNAGVAKPYKPKTGKFCIKKYRCDKHSTSDTESFFNRYDIQPGDREIIMVDRFYLCFLPS